MINILKANELLPGARILGRQGRALNGVELASGLISLVEQRLGDDGRLAIEEKLSLEWWPSMHLTFPRVVIEWCDSKNEDGTIGIWLRCLLGTGKVWEFRYLDEGADIRDLQKLGPFGTPDDMRDALGLPRIAQFKLPSGEIVTAELPGEHLRPSEPRREEILAQLAEVPQLIVKPEDKPCAERVADHLTSYEKYAEACFELEEGEKREKFEVPQLIAKSSGDIEVVRKEAGEAVDRMQAKPTITGGFVSDFSNRFDTPKEELLAEPPTVETTPTPPKVVEAPKKAGLRKAAAKGGKK